jgi:putative redox protein
MANPTSLVELIVEWRGDQRMQGRVGAVEVTLDGSGQAGPSPVQAIAFGLAACMAIDVVHILTKGRLEVKALRAQLRGERAGDDPRRFLRFELHFALRGEIPADKVERALRLSRDKYCSVWHSLRQDIELETTFDILS